MIPRTLGVKLAQLRRRERLLALAWGTARWLAVVLTALLAACFVDWLVDRERDTPWAVRRLLLAAQVMLAAAVGYWFLVRPQLHRLRDDTLALWVEDRHPALRHRLISAVQLTRPTARREGMSMELIAVVAREAEQHSAALDFAAVADHGRLRRAAVTLAPVLVLTAVLFLLLPDLCNVLLARQLMADVEIPRSVYLEPVVWDEVRPAGEKVTLQFRVRSADIDPDWLGDVYVTPRGQPRDRYDLEFSRMDGADAIFQATIAPSSVDLTYTARLRDGRLRQAARLAMVPRPVVIEQLAWVQLPAFCGAKPDGGRYEQPQGRGDIVGIPGSSARVFIKTQKPVRRAFLQVFGPKPEPATVAASGPDTPAASFEVPEIFKREVVLTLGADGITAEGAFDLRPDESGYRIVTVDEHGFDNVPAPRRGLRLAPEEPPQVALLKEQMPPSGPIALEASWEDFEVDGLPIVPGKKIRVAYVAQGPYGLGRARFLYRIIKKTESGNEEAKEEPWRALDLPEIKANPVSGAFDPKRGAFEHSPLTETIYFHAVPSSKPDSELGRTLGGGRFDFETKGIPDGMGGLLTLRVGDQLEFCVEVFADKDVAAQRPSARSDVRIRPIISGEDFARWFSDALQEERRLKDLDAKQRGVFELR